MSARTLFTIMSNDNVAEGQKAGIFRLKIPNCYPKSLHIVNSVVSACQTLISS